MNLIPIITTAGLSAVFNATNDGLAARLTHVAFGDTGWQPDNTATALQNERTRVPISNGSRISPTQIHVTAIENGSVEYWVREIAFILDDGTVLAVWSNPTEALAFKAADVDLLLALDFVLSALPEDSVEVVGTGGVNLPPATETVIGVVRFATQVEAIAGTLETVVMSPSGTRAHGDARYALSNHNHNGIYSPIDHNHDTRNDQRYSALSHHHNGQYSPINHNHNTQYSAINHNHDGRNDGRYSRLGHNHNNQYSDINHNHDSRNNQRYSPINHNHDGRYLQRSDTIITQGFVRTIARKSGDPNDLNNFNANFADVFPPAGFTMANLQGFVASIGIILFGGTVDGNDILWCRWTQRRDSMRVICANSENRADGAGAGSYINYLAIWRR